MHHFPTYVCYKMVHCGIWVWYIVGFMQWIYWITIWILRHKKILDRVDLYHWYGDLILIHSKWKCIFNNSGTRLAQRAETGLFDTVIFTVFLSSIHAVLPCRMALDECSSDTVHSVFKAFSIWICHFAWITHEDGPGPKRPVLVCCVTCSQKYL